MTLRPGVRIVLLTLFAGLPALPASATTYFVRPSGSDSCSGTADADAAGSGTACAFRSIDKCDAALAAGDTCTVAAGTYAELLRPSRGGSSTARIVYSCPSKACVIRPGSGDAMSLDARSYVTVDGFIFEGRVVPWNNGSAGNLVSNATVRGVGGQPPYYEINAGCGTDNTLDTFSVTAPRDTLVSPLVVGVNCSSPTRDRRASFRNGTIRGGRNAVQFDNCDDCVVDGLRLMHAWNHTFSVGGDTTNLTIRNSIFYASTSFRETIPDARSIHGLTFVNNAVVFATNFPGYNVPAVVDGKITIRNNVFYNFGSGSSEGTLWMNDANTATWDVDYNAHLGAGNLTGGAPFWKDLRNGANFVFYPDLDGDGTLGTPSGTQDFDDWQKRGRNPDGTNWDQHSLVIADSDYRRSAAGYAHSVWGTSAPVWGGVVSCVVNASSFDTHSQWGEAVAVGDLIEYELDGTLRTVTSVSSNSCGRRIAFTPALPAAAAGAAWILSWGQQDPDGDGTAALRGTVTSANRDGFKPVTGSALIDGGDPLLCGHLKKGLRCDIGPMEADSSSTDTQAPTAPSNLATAAALDAVNLNWTASTDNVGVTLYEIFRSLSPGSGYAQAGTATVTSWTDAAVDPGVTYSYEVRAADAAGNRSGFSNQVSGQSVADTQAPTTPASLAASAVASAVVLTWAPSTDDTGVTGYDVLRSTVSGAGFTTVGTAAATTWTDTTGTAGTTYYYRVRAFDTAGNRSSESNQASAVFPDAQAPTAPSGLTATPGVMKVDLAWTAATDNIGVTSYTVQRSLSLLTGYAPIGSTAGTRYTDSSVTVGTTYYYQVFASDAAGNASPGSNRVSARPSSPPDTEPPTAPANLTATPGTTSVALAWDSSTDNTAVSDYDVFRSTTSGSSFAKVGNTTTTSWTDAAGAGGARYYYLVRANDTAGNASADSNEATAVFPSAADTQPPTAPSGLAAVPGIDHVDLTWNPSTDDVGVTGYRVSRSTVSGTGYAPVATTASTSWTDLSVAAGTTYYYRSQAQDAASNLSPNSNEASATPGAADTTAPSVPSSLDGSSRPSSAHLAWDASTDDAAVTGYEVLRAAQPGGPYAAIGTATATSWDDGSAPSGVLLYYVVRAKDAAGNRSGLSNEAACGRATLLIVSSVPAAGATGVSWQATPQVRLSEPVEARTVSNTSVRLVAESNGTVVDQAAGSPRVEADGATVTIIPLHPLYASTSYRVEVLTGSKAPRSVEGNVRLSSSFQASFVTTASGTNAAAPFQAESLVPTDGAVDVSTDTSLSVNFLSAVDPVTLTKKRFKLFGPTGAVRLAPAPVVPADGMSVIWQPLRPLAAATSYRLEIKGGKKGIRGAGGQPLPDAITISFTTQAMPASAAMELGVEN